MSYYSEREREDRRGGGGGGSGANRLAEIFGTEKDRVNCPFYLKIGGTFTDTEATHVNESASYVKRVCVSLYLFHRR